jgi:pimeloyl-ACP methyl ester carboxylesterase
MRPYSKVGRSQFRAFACAASEPPPAISAPTITLEGDANGAPHPDVSAYAKKFLGKYSHRVIGGGVGHNLPQEAPQAFAQAILDVSRV